MLGGADPQLVREFQKSAFHARIPVGADVFLEGDPVEAIALLISGVVRVYKIGETGRQITLYRFGDGQSCILTANAILSRKTFPAVATVERDAEAVMVPADSFRDWVNRHGAWREFVFDLLSTAAFQCDGACRRDRLSAYGHKAGGLCPRPRALSQDVPAHASGGRLRTGQFA